VDIEAAAAPSGLLYTLALSPSTPPFPQHYVTKGAAELRDFHDALAKELGYKEAYKLPPFPLLMECRSHLAGSHLRQALNDYFSRLVCDESAMGTYTFHNFFQLAKEHGRFHEMAPRCFKRAAPPRRGSWLLGRKVDCSREEQPEEEPAVQGNSAFDSASEYAANMLQTIPTESEDASARASEKAESMLRNCRRIHSGILKAREGISSPAAKSPSANLPATKTRAADDVISAAPCVSSSEAEARAPAQEEKEDTAGKEVRAESVTVESPVRLLGHTSCHPDPAARRAQLSQCIEAIMHRNKDLFSRLQVIEADYGKGRPVC
jgi:hypothetical protein